MAYKKPTYKVIEQDGRMIQLFRGTTPIEPQFTYLGKGYDLFNHSNGQIETAVTLHWAGRADCQQGDMFSDENGATYVVAWVQRFEDGEICAQAKVVTNKVSPYNTRLLWSLLYHIEGEPHLPGESPHLADYAQEEIQGHLKFLADMGYISEDQKSVTEDGQLILSMLRAISFQGLMNMHRQMILKREQVIFITRWAEYSQAKKAFKDHLWQEHQKAVELFSEVTNEPFELMDFASAICQKAGITQEQFIAGWQTWFPTTNLTWVEALDRLEFMLEEGKGLPFKD
jgi:hypothetical protein